MYCASSRIETGKRGIVDIWAYYNNAGEVELFLNVPSLGTRKKTGDDLHITWRISYTNTPGYVEKDGKVVATKELKRQVHLLK